MTHGTPSDLCAEWSEVVDHVIGCALQRRHLSFEDRVRLTRTIIDAPIGKSIVARGLQRLIAGKHLGVRDGLNLSSMEEANSSPSYYSLGRAALLGLTRPIVDPETVVTDVCVAMHLGERNMAADGLVMLLLATPKDCPRLIVRFTRQAISYLEATASCFPDVKLSRTLSWISIINQQD